MTVTFYSAREQPYGCFSNFSAHPIALDGRRWPTSEHYFQAMKFWPHEVHVEAVRLAPTPKAAAEAGRSRARPLRSDWEAVKDDVMRRAVLAKFEQHPDIARVLLSTGDEAIVEATTHDHHWGCGASGTGKNMLGVILVETREALRARAREGGKP